MSLWKFSSNTQQALTEAQAVAGNSSNSARKPGHILKALLSELRTEL
jgi:hypothetical protein